MGVLCLVGWKGLWLCEGLSDDAFVDESILWESLASSLSWEASKTLTLFAVRMLEST